MGLQNTPFEQSQLTTKILTCTKKKKSKMNDLFDFQDIFN